MRHSDINFVEPELHDRYPNVFAIVRITKPKTRIIHSAATVQHVVVQDQHLAEMLQRAWHKIPAHPYHEVIWSENHTVHGYRFKQLLKSVTGSAAWTLAGLRGGGATDFYLRIMDVMSLRRRGRWAQLSTVDRYVQEAAACLQDDSMTPAERSKVAELARFGAAIISTMEFPTPLCQSQL